MNKRRATSGTAFGAFSGMNCEDTGSRVAAGVRE
jgi:hypothetical protein